MSYLSERATPLEVAHLNDLLRDVRICHLITTAWVMGHTAALLGAGEDANPYQDRYEAAVKAYEDYKATLVP